MFERVGDIGEFGLIGRINDLLQKEGIRTERVTIGIGDDTASFLPRPGFVLLVTCDCMVEGRHYLPKYIGPFDLGRRAMALNISDIGAMGGKPLYALISLGLKGEIPVQDIENMYRGFLAELSPFVAAIIGGNLTRSGDGMFIDITLIGEVEQGKGVRRSGARTGRPPRRRPTCGCSRSGPRRRPTPRACCRRLARRSSAGRSRRTERSSRTT